MDFPEVRKFLLAAYHDLPNILFVGSLILGSLIGYLPLVWLALGLIFNAAITSAGQYALQLLLESFPSTIGRFESQLRGTNLQRCTVGFQFTNGSTENPRRISRDDSAIVAPSYWMSASAFFAAFSIYNSIRVTARDTKGKVDPLLVSARKAFSLSTLIIGLFFMMIIMARGWTGCETMTGGILGVLMGSGVAIGFWHILDACGTGKLPDVLQVVGSMAPDQTKKETPVMCTAPPE